MLSWGHPDQPRERRFAAVVAGGPVTPSSAVCTALRDAAFVVAADSGADRVSTLGRAPDIVVGDLDSIRPDNLSALRARGVPIRAFDLRKNFTDSELALIEAVERGYADIVLLGWIGGARHDHSLANQLLLAGLRFAGAKVTILEGELSAYVVSDELRLYGMVGDRVSLQAIAGDATVSTKGLEYPLQAETLVGASARGVSNVMTAEVARVTVASGVVMAMHFLSRAEDAPATESLGAS